MTVEILAYYIPFVDHLLDTISVPMATIAGSVMFASQFADLGTFPQWGLASVSYTHLDVYKRQDNAKNARSTIKCFFINLL